MLHPHAGTSVLATEREQVHWSCIAFSSRVDVHQIRSGSGRHAHSPSSHTQSRTQPRLLRGLLLVRPPVCSVYTCLKAKRTTRPSCVQLHVVLLLTHNLPAQIGQAPLLSIPGRCPCSMTLRLPHRPHLPKSAPGRSRAPLRGNQPTAIDSWVHALRSPARLR